MKRSFFMVLCAVLCCSLLLSACEGSARSDAAAGGGDTSDSTEGIVQLRIGGAGQNSWAYSCMVALSEAIKQVDSNMDLVIQATPGSTNHYGMFASDELDGGTGFTPTDYWALNGTPPLFEESYEDMFYTIAPTTISKTHVVVRAKSDDITSLSDLNGRKVYAGDQGGASTQMALNIIEVLGIDCEIIQADRAEGFEMLKDGRVDAVFQSQGAPYANILELASAVDLKLVPFSSEELDTCMAAGPYCFPGELTPDEYEFVTETVPTLTQVQNIIVKADLDDDLVYRLTKDIVEAWDDVVLTIPAAGKVNPLEDVVKSVVKIHPGAIRYYEEQGVAIPDELRP